MTRYLLLATVLFLTFVSVAPAQVRGGDNEIAYGYSLSSAGLRQDEHFTYHGIGVNYTRYLGENVGILGDFSYHLRNESNLMYFLGGVRYQFPGEHANVFLQGLAGASRLNPEIGESQTEGLFGGGGGVDWRVWHNVGLRIPQVDVLFGSRDGENFYDVRVLIGVTWTL